MHGSYVTLCKTSLSWACKTRNMYTVCCKKYNYSQLSATTFRNEQQPDLVQDRFNSCVVKRETYLWNSFWSNVAKQVTFLPPILPPCCNVKTSLVKNSGIFFYTDYEWYEKKPKMYIVCSAENLRGNEKIINVPFLRKTLYYNDLVKLFPSVWPSVLRNQWILTRIACATDGLTTWTTQSKKRIVAWKYLH